MGGAAVGWGGEYHRWTSSKASDLDTSDKLSVRRSNDLHNRGTMRGHKRPGMC